MIMEKHNSKIQKLKKKLFFYENLGFSNETYLPKDNNKVVDVFVYI